MFSQQSDENWPGRYVHVPQFPCFDSGVKHHKCITEDKASNKQEKGNDISRLQLEREVHIFDQGGDSLCRVPQYANILPLASLFVDHLVSDATVNWKKVQH